MCTLAIYFRHSRNLPLVVAANRDEFYARPTAEPRVLTHDPWVLGGQDLHAGGTWFGVNQYGMVVGLLNRRNPDGPDPNCRSRGLLCLEALQRHDPGQVVESLRGLAPADYNHFNMLAANTERASVIVNNGAVFSIHDLPPGIHVLTNADVNDPTCPRIAHSHRLFERVVLEGDDRARLRSALRTILSDHESSADQAVTGALCVHAEMYGTRSSSIVMSASVPGRLRYWHAAGPPCRTGYVEVQLPNAALG